MDGPRILVVARWFPHHDEPGLGPFVHEQVRCLREKEGLDVRVVSGRECPLSLRRPYMMPVNWCRYQRGFSDLHWQTWDGVPVLYFPYLAGRLSNWVWHAPYRDALLRAMPAVRRSFPFDLIHAHTANPDGFAAMHLARQDGVPYVLTEHTGPFHVITDKLHLRRQTLTAMAGARRVWCVSHSLQQEVRSYFPLPGQSHIHFLPNGVDTTSFALSSEYRPPSDKLPASALSPLTASSQASSLWLQRDHRPNKDRPRLLFVGFLNDYKDPLMLLDAFAQVRARIPGAVLNVAGDGLLRAAMVRRIGELGLEGSVKMHGYCGRAEVARLMREECDLFVLSSKSETFGVVLIEALASGKPVVATRCGGPESIVTDRAVGTLCPPNDAGAFAEAVLSTIDRLPQFDARKIRKFACDHFDYRILARNLAAAYREILRDGRKAAA